MATEAQIAANKRNAKTAGVKTEEGKRISRHNSFKHGMAAKTLLGDSTNFAEAESDYLAIVEGLRDALRPRNQFEDGLIEGMAKASFKLRRFDFLEAQYFRTVEDNLGLSLFQEVRVPDDRFELALKYKQSLEAQYFRALDALMRTRQAGKQLDLFLPAGGDG